jgi:hypothetical protein
VKYVIVSDRVGTPGDKFEPSSPEEAEILLAGGFITQADRKSAKMETEPTEE